MMYSTIWPQSDIHTKFYTDLIGRSSNITVVRHEVVTAVTMKDGVFWDVTPCGECKNRRFGGP
jgi:hypothetical protein